MAGDKVPMATFTPAKVIFVEIASDATNKINFVDQIVPQQYGFEQEELLIGAFMAISHVPSRAVLV